MIIKPVLKSDLEKWDNQRKQRSEAGKKSAEARKRKLTSVNENKQESTVNVNDNVNVSTYLDDKVIDEVYLKARDKYLTYITQLLSDEIFKNSISREFFQTTEKNIQDATLKKYLKGYLNRLDQDKRVHNNKKQFMEHFPNWLRKQDIKLVTIPKQQKRYV